MLRHLATRHIAGSRTSAPRDEATVVAAPPSDEAPSGEVAAPRSEEAAAVPATPAVTVSEDDEPEYAGAEEQPGEDEEEV